MDSIQRLREAEPRIETGVIQFGNDWPGVFIRGKHAFDFYMRLSNFIEDENLSCGVIDELCELFKSSDIREINKVNE